MFYKPSINRMKPSDFVNLFSLYSLKKKWQIFFNINEYFRYWRLGKRLTIPKYSWNYYCKYMYHSYLDRLKLRYKNCHLHCIISYRQQANLSLKRSSLCEKERQNKYKTPHSWRCEVYYIYTFFVYFKMYSISLVYYTKLSIVNKTTCRTCIYVRILITSK